MKNQISKIKYQKPRESPREKIGFFERRILDFFKKAGREHLPWRKKRITTYEVWVSEIMLQQTQVSRVTGYYTRFLKRFPNVETLAKTSWKSFLPYYEGLGYYARGRNMLKAARIIMEEYDGRFPRERKLLETLPGIGSYTAAAIMSFAYGDEHLAWDTNLHRVIGRFFYGGKQLVVDEAWWEHIFETPKKALNAALMDFGSALCVARPRCTACALRNRCAYYQERGRREMQDTRRKIRKKKGANTDWKEARAYVFLHENHRKYFSADTKTFRPFILPSGYNTRAGIKVYFQKRYGLSLSVRPPYQKAVIKGTPILCVNAQILSGTPAFAVFSKKARERYNEHHRSNM